MSIIKYVKDELPQEGAVVYCDNGDFSSDRAIFSNGKFVGGGDFPAPMYNMSFVSKWFYIESYYEYHKKIGKNSYNVTFDIANTIP